jgi:hypothetical protein
MAPETGSPFTRNFPTSVTCSILNEIFCTKHCRLKSNNKTHSVLFSPFACKKNPLFSRLGPKLRTSPVQSIAMQRPVPGNRRRRLPSRLLRLSWQNRMAAAALHPLATTISKPQKTPRCQNYGYDNACEQCSTRSCDVLPQRPQQRFFSSRRHVLNLGDRSNQSC